MWNCVDEKDDSALPSAWCLFRSSTAASGSACRNSWLADFSGCPKGEPPERKETKKKIKWLKSKNYSYKWFKADRFKTRSATSSGSISLNSMLRPVHTIRCLFAGLSSSVSKNCQSCREPRRWYGKPSCFTLPGFKRQTLSSRVLFRPPKQSDSTHF